MRITTISTLGSFVLATAGLVLAATTASAAVLTQYNFDTNLAATTTGTNVTASDVSDGGGFGTEGARSFDGTTTPTLTLDDFSILEVDAPDAEETFSAAHTGGDYLEFTVSADSGLLLNLEKLTFVVNNHVSLNTTKFNLSLRSDVDSFTSDIETVSDLRDNLDGVTQTFDLSGSDFQGLEEVTFRLVMFSSEEGNFENDFRGFGVDDLTLNGQAVPEPSAAAMALVGFGGLGLLGRRRR